MNSFKRASTEETITILDTLKKEHSITREMVATYFGVNRTTLHRWEEKGIPMRHFDKLQGLLVRPDMKLLVGNQACSMILNLHLTIDVLNPRAGDLETISKAIATLREIEAKITPKSVS